MRAHFLLTGLALAGTVQSQSPVTPPYQDARLPVQERVQDLLGRMTLPEKVGQLAQIDVTRLMGTGEWDRGPLNPEWLKTVLDQDHVGSLLSGGGAAPLPNTPQAWAKMTDDLQRYAMEHSRLHIPILYGTDAVHGHNNVLGATLFPHNVGLAATFDPNLTRQIGAVTAKALRATGVTWDFAPVSDVGRDPRWGRFYETFGEDPALVSAMVAASVRGLQGDLGPESVAATLKHFVGYGAPDSGHDRENATISAAALQNVQLPPFRAGMAAGALSVMVNSGAVNGVPVHASHDLLTDVLRGDLGFRGVALSDWEDVGRLASVYHVAPTYEDAVRQALTAGVDVSMVPHDAPGFTAAVLDLVKSGQLPQDRVDQAAGRVLALKFRLGLFEHPYADGNADAAVTAGKDLAARAARAAITLLKNDGNALPLKGAKSVLVVGERANDARSQLGGWSVGWQGVPDGERAPAVTVLDGLKRGLPKGMKLAFDADLSGPVAADTVVAVVGENSGAEGKADNPDLSLPAPDLDVLRRALASGKPVVAVLLAGRPVLLPPDVRGKLAALVMAYLPGSEGGRAVADVLYGNTDPSGRLPFSWPASLDQLPLQGDASGQGAPLYPYGAGLSYTTFSEKNLRAEAPKDNQVTLSVDVTNTGGVAGTHSVLAFVHQAAGATSRPERRLAAYGHVILQPGETRTVRLDVSLARLASGTYQVQVGDESTTFERP